MKKRTASPPDDIFEEPLTLENADAIAIFGGIDCYRCGKEKPNACWLCVKCFDSLDPQLRKALQGFRFTGWRHALCRVIRQRPTLE